MTARCCPRLDPAEWDKLFWVWDKKPFYAARFWSIFNLPLTLDSAIRKAVQDIESRGVGDEEPLLFQRDEAMLHSTLLVSIKKYVDDLPVETVSGRFYSRLFEGKYSDSGRFAKEVNSDLKLRGLSQVELMFYYPTCADCLMKRGVGQVVVFARVK